LCAPPRHAEMNIYDLTEQESAWIGVPHTGLLIEALRAIGEGRLSAKCGLKADLPAVRWSGLIRGWIRALELDPRFFIRQFRFIFVEPADYRNWRDQSSLPPSEQKVRRPKGAAVRCAARNYIDTERNESRQTSQKRAWEHIRSRLPGATYRQVMDAMEAEVGKKRPGRPRKTASAES
jgi:hypothetical protein